MNPQNLTQHLGKRRARNRGVAQLFSVFVSVVLLVAQMLPVAASFSSGPSAGWIEICGETGASFIQLEAGAFTGDSQPPEHEADCTHCPFCLVPFNTVYGAFSPQVTGQNLLAFTKINFAAALIVNPRAPEQFWSACRGPPVPNTENNMTTHSLPALPLARAVSNTWGIPCS
ncbi:MAG: DUF2946 family protein [Rhodobacteraceae bacterium]|nr:DUF2946 family protein [Paracoccaceae bacterium]